MLLGPNFQTEALALDERKLAEQWEKTGSFMDLCRDEAWLDEAARIEDECNGRVEAGLAVKAYAAAKYDPALADVRKGLRRKMRLQSILFSELNRWMKEWDIGAAFEETYTEARQLVRAHLKQPSPVLSDWIEAVLEEDKQPDDTDQPVRSQTRAQLTLMMTDEDWKTLAQVAAAAAADIASASVRKASQVEPKTTVAA
ncbi:MAG: hypothetical protein AAFS04_10465 [Cyanobacteria bacterium J06631_9]